MSLRIFGVHTVLELAPVLLAAEKIYGDAAVVHAGGMANLALPGGHKAGASSKSYDANAPVVQASGQADVATNAETQALRVSLDRSDIRIVLNVSEGLYRIVARRSAGIRSIADLRGKRIGTMPWTSAAYYLHKELKNAGLSDDDAQIIPISPAAKVAPAMIRGDVDAIAIWEPGSQQALDALGADGVELQTPGLYREMFNLNTTTERLSDPRTRAELVKFIGAIVASCREITAHPEAGWRVADKVSGHPADVIRSCWLHHRFVATIPADMLDVMVEEDRWMSRENARPARSRAELASLVDRSLFDEAMINIV